MSEKLDKAFEIANYMTALASQKQILKEEFHQNLIHYHNGGMFTVTRELINFLKTLIDLEKHSTVLVDDNELPIDIEDADKFFNDIVSKYQFAINGYYTQYTRLRNSRTVQGLVS